MSPDSRFDRLLAISVPKITILMTGKTNIRSAKPNIDSNLVCLSMLNI